ncbi:COMM domain-containing protein 5 [Cavenderia fasciculata]|uniref:COMM domain-containing protein 5 n=1 Tax=Cavenderia fasciculata TaxID=261658 RepID=F4PST9_CACFS|nr:COMM domain-containing protein 5 [Cavenderia fasciculata]EGG21567.1 COMM domain-containing protein 5 [Cavenderia fasciculata]|eukprot:XP_004359417.1 COMM domain-containing protein 5 [Cavenderia fasciculata]
MDRISFLGYNTPTEVKNVLPILAKIEQSYCRQIVSLVVSYLKAKKIDSNQQEYQKFNQITKEIHDKLSIASQQQQTQQTQQQDDQSSILFTGIYYILKLAIKTKVSVEYFITDLTELKIPSTILTDLQKVYTNIRKELIDKVLSDKILFPQLETLKWRVDVIISSSFTSRILHPIILMETTDTKGNKRTFEVSVDMFHKLRYNVSKVLKDMEDLDQLPILKIDK